MLVVPREFTSAAEIRANAKAVRERFRSLREPERPRPPPRPVPVLVVVSPPVAIIPQEAAPILPPPPPSRHVRSVRVRDMVAKHYAITVEEIAGESRCKIYIKPRHIAMYLCMRHVGMSSPQIGRLFGMRDHSTVICAVHKIARHVERDTACAAEVAEFVRQIEGWS